MPPTPGRNDPCPCGSGLKYKKCCGQQPIDAFSPDALFQQAQAHRQRGALANALENLAQLLQRQPRHVAALWLQAEVQVEQGQTDAAIRSYQQLLRLAPTHYAAQYNLASLLKNAGQLESALTAFERALTLNSLDADCHNNHGNTLAELGRHEDAIKAFRRAIEYQPGLTQAYVNIGRELQHQGDFTAAAANYELALERCGEHAALYRGLSATRKFGPDDLPLINRIQSYAQHTRLNTNDRAEIEFALGKIHDDLKAYPAAFAHYAAGNQIMRSTFDFRFDEAVRRAERIMQVFSQEVLASIAPWQQESAKPIIIMGMPRSGTSLIEQILASHPAVHGGGELEFWREADVRLFPDYYKEISGQARGIASRYLRLLEQFSPSALRVTDKLPGNFWHAGLIHLLFPAAHIIHCRRNPVDTCLSIFFQKFVGEHPYAYDLQELADYYRLYRRLTRHWKQVIPASRYTEVYYEDLVSSPETESRRLLEFCGLDWNAHCLDYHQKSRQVKTASSWQVRQPIYQSSRERWRHYETFIEPLIRLLEEDDSPSSTPTRPLPRAA